MQMKISYKRLWKQLIDREMKKKDLIAATGIGASTMAKMNKGELVSLEVLLRICETLKCDFGDIIEAVEE